MTTFGILDYQSTFAKGLEMVIAENQEYKVLINADDFDKLQYKLKSIGTPIDIFFLPVHTPTHKGLLIAQWMHKNYPATKMIVTSNEVKYLELYNMFQSGCIAFISKWAQEKVLLKSIASIMENTFHSAQNECIDSRTFFELKVFNGVNIPVLNELDKRFAPWFVTSLNYHSIALEMHVSDADVDYHRRTFFQELEVDSRSSLIIKLIQLG